MDEVFGVSKMMTTKSMFTSGPENSNKPRPTKYNDSIPNGIWHLTIMNFRRAGRVTKPEVVDWCLSEWRKEGLPIGSSSPELSPQNIVSLLCRSMNTWMGSQFTPVELDDFFMNVAADSTLSDALPSKIDLCRYGTCHDEKPECARCVLGAACQAANDPLKVNFKSYIT